MSFYLARYIYSSQNVIKFVHLKMLYSPICACAQRSPLFVSARSARYYAIEFVCGCVRVCVKHSGRLIRAVRLRTGRKTNMAAFYTGWRETVCLTLADC
jgi:hypothetical protein